MRLRFDLCISLAFLCTVALVGCGGDPAVPPGPSPAAGAVSSATAAPAATLHSAPADANTPITSRLALSHAPLLQELATLTYTVQTVFPAANAATTITLPSGATLVSGALTWEGALVPDRPHTLTAEIRFTEEGNWTLTGTTLSPQENGDVWGDAASIYLFVSSSKSHAGFKTDENSPTQAPGAEVPSPPAVDPAPP